MCNQHPRGHDAAHAAGCQGRSPVVHDHDDDRRPRTQLAIRGCFSALHVRFDRCLIHVLYDGQWRGAGPQSLELPSVAPQRVDGSYEYAGDDTIERLAERPTARINAASNNDVDRSQVNAEAVE